MDEQGMLKEARRVIAAEAEAVRSLCVDTSFADAVRIVNTCSGQVIVSGLGKSGCVAQRLATTLRAVRVPAWFLHPSDALHGDVGAVQTQDAVILISRGGETREIVELAEECRMLCAPVIVITTVLDSALGRKANVVLLHHGDEACPHGLLPTSSTTQASVLGDALALVLQQERGLTAADFATLHQGGTLGRRLALRVEEVMLTGTDVGRIRPMASLQDAMIVLAWKRGTLVVESLGNHRFLGVVTAGDIARVMKDPGWVVRHVETVMTRTPHITVPDMLVSNAIKKMQEGKIMAMPVLAARPVPGVANTSEVVGMIHLHDALWAGVQ